MEYPKPRRLLSGYIKKSANLTILRLYTSLVARFCLTFFRRRVMNVTTATSGKEKQ